MVKLEIIPGSGDNKFYILNQIQFSNNIKTMFESDEDKHDKAKRLAVFDSIHDFKTFGDSNPVDIIEYNRKLSEYYINRCFFNFNRIMCKGEEIISVENSFLKKPKGGDMYGYDNKPTPISAISMVEDYFVMLNLFKLSKKDTPVKEVNFNSSSNVTNLSNDDELFLIKWNPKDSQIDNPANRELHNKIRSLIIEKGYFDEEDGKKYINTVTDVSLVFRKYHMTFCNKVNDNISYRALITQESANDPAGSLRKEVLSTAFKAENVLIEKENQSRTYKNDEINSNIEPTLGGIKELKGVNIGEGDSNKFLNFKFDLTLEDTSSLNKLSTDTTTIPYSTFNETADSNPNERTEINSEIKKYYKRFSDEKTVMQDPNILTGRDDHNNSKAQTFYDNINNFSQEKKQKEIPRHFTRKRLGDVLLASVCRLINSKYDNDTKRIKFKTLTETPDISPKTAIFIGEDRMIISFCLINKIPCIYDSGVYTILYLPNKEEENALNKKNYDTYATIPSPPSPSTGGNKMIQTGGITTRRMAEFRNTYRDTIWEEPYYFYKFMPFFNPVDFTGTIDSTTVIENLSGVIQNINANFVQDNYESKVINFVPNNNEINDKMFLAFKKNDNTENYSFSENLAQSIVDVIEDVIEEYKHRKYYTFINIFKYDFSFNTPEYDNNVNNLLLSVAKLPSPDEITIFFNSQTITITKNNFNPKFEAIPILKDEFYKNDIVISLGLTDQQEEQTGGGFEMIHDFNIKMLEKYFKVLVYYEIFSIANETNDSDFFDINHSGVRIAFDCTLYVFFDLLVSEFENNYKNVNYELLEYFLYIYQYDLYISLHKIVEYSLNKTTLLNKEILEKIKDRSSKLDELTENTINYFAELLEKTKEKTKEIDTLMYEMISSNNYAGQYNLAAENNFTYFGFNSISNIFKPLSEIISREERAIEANKIFQQRTQNKTRKIGTFTLADLSKKEPNSTSSNSTISTILTTSTTASNGRRGGRKTRKKLSNKTKKLKNKKSSKRKTIKLKYKK